MPKIVAFIGVIGSGKNYRQQQLVDKEGFVALDFKDELIDMCEDLVGYSIREDYEAFKQRIVGMKPLNPAEYCRSYPNAMTGRRLLQRMGTEVMRKRDPDYWVKAWEKKSIELLKQGKNIAVADARFLNELNAIKGMEVHSFAPITTKVVFCNYKSERYDPSSTHESEKMAQEILKMGYQDQEEVAIRLQGPSDQISLKSIVCK